MPIEVLWCNVGMVSASVELHSEKQFIKINYVIFYSLTTKPLTVNFQDLAAIK